MPSPLQHTYVTGRRTADRQAYLRSVGGADVSVSCHARVRGPYAGVRQLLRALVPAVHRALPDLTERHRLVILMAAPELATVIGEAPMSLTQSTHGAERTRYQSGMTLRAAHGLTELLCSYANRLETPLRLAFDDVHAADATDQEFLSVLLRRSQGLPLSVLVCATGGPLDATLAEALATFAATHDVPAGELPPAKGDEEMVREFVESDGTIDDSRWEEAWSTADPTFRAELHDRRATKLTESGELEYRLGAIPFHLEHGSDRRRAVEAFDWAAAYCMDMAFNAAAMSLAQRGRALADPATEEREYVGMSTRLALCTAFTQPEESERIYRELLSRYDTPRVHMTTSYHMSMLYTRFHSPAKRDEVVARMWINNAIAHAKRTEDPAERSFFTTFMENGRALIETNAGNFEAALELVNRGAARLERDLESDAHLLHRSILGHNRARVIAAMGLLAEAKMGFDAVIATDPYYPEYYLDRGNLLRQMGDDDAALADYETAMTLGGPFPELYYNRSDIRADRGDLVGAIADLDYVLVLQPDNVLALNNRASLRLEVGDFAGSLEDARSGLALDPGNVDLLVGQGLAASELGDIELARSSYEEALTIAPRNEAALANYSALLFESGDIDGAIASLTSALDLNGPHRPVLLANRAAAYAAAGKSAEAAADCTAALKDTSTDRGRLLLLRGECSLRLGHTDSAWHDFTDAASLGSADDAERAQSHLRRLAAGVPYAADHSMA